MPRRLSAKSTPLEPPSGSILQLKVRLLGVSPMVWRRLRVPASYTLEERHGVVQVAMGWEGIHLYRFWIRAVRYGSLELCVSSPCVSLDAFRFCKGAKFVYDYDMTDFWRHEVRIEDWLEPERGLSYPVCIAGDHAGPPEDCGGSEGYADRRCDAVDDVVMLAGLVETIVVEKRATLLGDPDTPWQLEEVVDRIQARAPFLANAVSRRPVKRRFRQDDHHVLMHQQL